MVTSEGEKIVSVTISNHERCGQSSFMCWGREGELMIIELFIDTVMGI